MRSLFGFGAGTLSGFLYNSYSRPMASAAPQPALSASEFRPFRLIYAADESPDTKVLRFALADPEQTLGLNVASCVVFRCTNSEGKNIIRPYTPITPVDQKGYFEIIIKKYKASNMGTFLHSLSVGQTVDVKGPFEKYSIKPNGMDHIGLIAGGTGIAPCYQVIQHLLANPADKTKLSLIYANKERTDVLLGSQLNNLMEKYSRFSCYYLLSQPHSNWMGGVGHVNADMIRGFMPAPVQDRTLVMVSGPPGMMGHVCGDKDFKSSPPTQGELKGLLRELGYAPGQVFKF